MTFILEKLKAWSFWINTILLSFIGLSGLFFNDPILNRTSKLLSLLFGGKETNYEWLIVRIAVVTFIVGVLLKFFMQFVEWNIQKENTELKKKLDDAEEMNNTWKMSIPDIIKGYLYTFADWRLWFCDDHCSDHRISIYAPADEAWEDFYLVGRYSPNPDLGKKSGREYRKWGMIWKVWSWSNTGEIIMNLSDPTLNNGKDYRNDCRGEFWWSSQDSKEKFANLKMKARYYYWFRIVSSSDSSKYVAMILVESMKPDFMQKDKIYDIFTKSHAQISELLTRLLPHFSRPYTGNDI